MANPKKKKSKWKKIAKNVGKAAVIAGALYGGSKLLGKGRLKGRADKLTEGDIGIGQRAPRVDDYNYIPKPKKWDIPHDKVFGNGIGIAKGGRVGKKNGGRTGKQFGGGLNRPVARPIGGVGAPVRPLAYKHGGKVKSMGVAKRGGGIAKR